MPTGAGDHETGSSKKLEEHGGFAHDDTNLMLLLSNPALRPRTVFSEVGKLQIAPTILRLSASIRRLDGVRLEGIRILPDLNLDFDQHRKLFRKSGGRKTMRSPDLFIASKNPRT